MTGNELSRQLVKRGDKVIGFDNFFASSINTVKDLLDNGAAGFLEKPHRISTLTRKIREILDASPRAEGK